MAFDGDPDDAGPEGGGDRPVDVASPGRGWTDRQLGVLAGLLVAIVVLGLLVVGAGDDPPRVRTEGATTSEPSTSTSSLAPITASPSTATPAAPTSAPTSASTASTGPTTTSTTTPETTATTSTPPTTGATTTTAPTTTAPADSTPPTMTASVDRSSATEGEQVTFTITADDDTALAAIDLLGGRDELTPVGSCATSPCRLDSGPLPPGRWRWQAIASDEAGNRTTQDGVVLVADGEDPTITLESSPPPSDGPGGEGYAIPAEPEFRAEGRDESSEVVAVELAWTATDAAGRTVAEGATTCQAATCSIRTQRLTDPGQLVVEVVATDASGRSTELQRTYALRPA